MTNEVQDDIAATIKELSTEGQVEKKQEPIAEEGKERATEEQGKEPTAERAEPKSGEADQGADKAQRDGDRPAEEGKWDHNKAPKSWNPAIREKWATLPEEVRKEIIRREEASVNGVRQLHEQVEPFRRFASDMAPVFQAAKEVGAHPVQYVGALMQSEKLLRTAAPQARFNEIIRIAEQYGVPLREIINRSVGEEVLKAPQQAAPVVPPEVDQRIRGLESRYQQEREQAQVREIQSFAKDKEFFNDVRGRMADLLDAGAADGLEDAYEQACWATPSVRAVMLEREKGAKQDDDLKRRREAAAGISVPGNGGLAVRKDSEDESIEDTVRNAFRASSGRV